jgi:predicted  nucleic acid-binding Zn-ribbon protein
LIDSLRTLVAVHELDVGLDQRREEHEALPGRRAELQAARLQAQESVAGIQQSLADAELEQRRLEGELRDQENLVARLEAQTYEVKTSEAYKTLQSEIAHARAAISERETRILELMETADAQHRELNRAEKNAREVEARAGEQEAAMAAREAELLKEREELESQRAKRAENVDIQLLAQYERIATWRRPALAIESGGVCTLCRMSIPRQNVIEVESGRSVVTCGGCQRILVGEKAIAPAGNPS